MDINRHGMRIHTRTTLLIKICHQVLIGSDLPLQALGSRAVRWFLPEN